MFIIRHSFFVSFKLDECVEDCVGMAIVGVIVEGQNNGFLGDTKSPNEIGVFLLGLCAFATCGGITELCLRV